MTFINSIKKESNNIVLKELDAPAPELLITDRDSISIAFLDTETTGTDRANDKIIEIAIKLVKFEAPTGKILSIDQTYESFNDPEEDISTEITQLTGITIEMVEGHSIDWGKVDSIFEDSDIIVAHNAEFDRAFVDRHSSVSQSKIWACSIIDIDWLNRGFTSPKQELLCHWHGFYFDAHRAMNDVDALIHLMTHESYGDDRPLIELIDNAKKPVYVIFADNFKYDPVKKDIIKTNKYRWNPDDRIWYKRVNFDELDSEKDWLTATIYNQVFEGRVEEINLNDKYKL